MTGIDCLSCGRVDFVQKITAIVEGETHHTTGHSRTTTFSSTSGKQDFYAQENVWKKTKIGQGKISGDTYGSSFESINAVQRSNLAQKLMPPDKPTPPQEPNFFSIWALIGSIILSVVVSLLAIAVCFIVIAFLSFYLPSIVRFFAIFIITPLIGLVVGTVSSVGFSSLMNKMAYSASTKKEMQNHYEMTLKKHLEYDLPRWESAVQRWNSMFYCRRCDVIFVPGDEVYCSGTDNVINLAYHNV